MRAALQPSLSLVFFCAAIIADYTDGVFDGECLIPLNGTLTLTCNLNGYEGGLDSTHMFFEYLNETVETERRLPVPDAYQHIVDNRTVRLIWPEVPLDIAGVFYCMINETGLVESKSRVVAMTEIKVVKPPDPIQNISCISDNGYNLTCRWCDQPEEGVYYTLKWMKGNSGAYACTPAMQKDGACACHWPDRNARGNVHPDDVYSNVFDYHMQVESREKLLNLTATSHIYDALLETIVKPRPPEHVTVASDAIGGATITWQRPPRPLPKYVILEYNITWSSGGGPPETKLTRDLTLKLTNLTPYTRYGVQVSARPYPDGLYTSDPAVTSFMTPQAVPSATPTIVRGMFRTVESNSNSRKVIVFWQPVPRDQMNGAFAGYTVRIRDSSSDHEEREYFVPTEDTYHAVLDELRSDRAYHVSVTASTEVGEGPPASMYLPSAQTALQQPVYIDGVINGSVVTFTVLPPEGTDVTSITILRCPGESIVQTCQGPPDTVRFDVGQMHRAKDEHSVSERYTVPMHGYGPGYVYSLAVNSAESTSGLGTHWLCLYDSNGDPGVVDFEFAPNQQQKSMSLHWSHRECSHTVRGKVTVFNIYVNGSGNVTRQASVGAVYGQLRYSYTVTGLRPSTLYSVWLAACTHSRCGSYKAAEFTTIQGPLPILFIIIPVCAVVLVTLIITLACVLRQKSTKTLTITIPEVDTVPESAQLMPEHQEGYSKEDHYHDSRDTVLYTKIHTRNDSSGSSGLPEDSGVDSGGSVSRSGSSSRHSETSENIEMYSLVGLPEDSREPSLKSEDVNELTDSDITPKTLEHRSNVVDVNGIRTSNQDVEPLSLETSFSVVPRTLPSFTVDKELTPQEVKQIDVIPQVIMDLEDISEDIDENSGKLSGIEGGSCSATFSESYCSGVHASGQCDVVHEPEGPASPTLAGESSPVVQTFKH